MSLAGLALSLSAPGNDLWFIAWFGIVPLFILLNTAISLKQVIIYSFVFGFSYNFSYLHWLFSLHPLNWLGFNFTESWLLSFFALITTSIYNSIYFILFGISDFYFKKYSVKPYNAGLISYVLITFIWLIIFNKLSSSELLLGFPWSLIEYSQYKNLFLIQIAEYFGSIFIGFLVVFFNLVLSELVLYFFNKEKIVNRYIAKDPSKLISILVSGSVAIFLIFASLIFGLLSYTNKKTKLTSSSQIIAVLQGNLPINVTRGLNVNEDFAEKTYTKLISDSKNILAILPEGALPIDINDPLTSNNWIRNIRQSNSSSLLFGTYCMDVNSFYNCAALYIPSIDKFSIYKKQRLVPFGEYIPFSNLLPEFLRRFAQFTIGEGFNKGKNSDLLQINDLKIGVNICFEIIFPNIIRNQSLMGANLLVNISDLGWFSNDILKKQFLSFGVFRAIENGKPLIIASNNGISAFIEPNGKIKNQTLPKKRTILADWITPNNNITFFSRFGW